MAKIRPRVPIGIPIAAVVLLILGLVAGPFIESSVPEEQLATNVLISAIPFLLIFVAIILALITIIWLVATALSNNIPERTYRPIETILIAGIVLGVVGLFQPWSFAVYRYSFQVLLISTLAFILWSHVIPKGVRRQEETSLSIGEFEQSETKGGE